MKRSASLLVDVLDGDRSLSLCLSSNRKRRRREAVMGIVPLEGSILHQVQKMDGSKRHNEGSSDKEGDFNFEGFGNFTDSVSPPAAQVPFLGGHGTQDENIGEDTPGKCKERRTWTPSDDVLLISSWLNTSKDLVVGNEQRSSAFCTRIAAYYSASPKVAGCEKRELAHSANRERTSGQNENDILKHAHEIFFNNYNKKFTLEHAWKELRHDQKWCDLTTAKTNGSSKRRKCEDGSHTASSQAIGTETGKDDQVTNRPTGVKAAKARGKRMMVEGKDLAEFQSLWSIKKEDLAMKEKLSKMRLLESLIAKQELDEYEERLEKKLITELLSN
ncbi:glutathione S-transferase T3-like [Brassica napus]|uniref:glutathione S-transferase T3-like n=1 Tax=Brassica napus TaxID=3708 RepID=UPI0006AB55FF|nr:glutathione S-transferase T3-like [Brassica napus]